MKGKDKCKILKEIRAQIAAANDIEWVTDNCTHKGECRGTCPKCEAEVAALERALERRRALGKTVVVAGLAAGMVVSTTSCALSDRWQSTDGDMLPETADTANIPGAPTQTEPEIIEISGDIIGNIYYTDFTACAPRLFETIKEVQVFSVIDSEGNESPEVTVPPDTRFEVVGEVEDWWLISYQGYYYCYWKSVFNNYAREVPAETAQTPEIGG